MKNHASKQSHNHDDARADDVDRANVPPNAPSDVPAKPQSKQKLLADLLGRDSGATLDEMIAATRWLPHTTSAALTGLKKKGYAISSDKLDGVRTDRAVAPGPSTARSPLLRAVRQAFSSRLSR